MSIKRSATVCVYVKPLRGRVSVCTPLDEISRITRETNRVYVEADVALNRTHCKYVKTERTTGPSAIGRKSYFLQTAFVRSRHCDRCDDSGIVSNVAKSSETVYFTRGGGAK